MPAGLLAITSLDYYWCSYFVYGVRMHIAVLVQYFVFLFFIFSVRSRIGTSVIVSLALNRNLNKFYLVAEFPR